MRDESAFSVKNIFNFLFKLNEDQEALLKVKVDSVTRHGLQFAITLHFKPSLENIIMILPDFFYFNLVVREIHNGWIMECAPKSIARSWILSDSSSFRNNEVSSRWKSLRPRKRLR